MYKNYHEKHAQRCQLPKNNLSSYLNQILINSTISKLAGLGSPDEIQLLEHLFQRQGYNPLIRPVANLSARVRVQFGMALIQLIDVVSRLFITNSLSNTAG